MKKLMIACLMLIMTSAFLTGCCGPKGYAVVTDDYTMYVSKDKPTVDANAGTITFKDIDNRIVSMPRYKVKQVAEVR